MRKALEEGKSIIMASHNPCLKATNSLDGIKGGYGAIYLANISDAFILPVAVEIIGIKEAGMSETKIKTFLHKPNAIIHIGPPIKLEKIKGIEDLEELAKNEINVDLKKTTYLSVLKKLESSLKTQSQFLMSQLAMLMPKK